MEIHSRRWWTLNKQISCFHANILSNTNKTKQRRKCSQSIIQAVVQLNRRDFRIFQRARRVSSYPSDFSNLFLQMVSFHNVGWKAGKKELEEWQSNLRTLQNSQRLSCSISSPQWEILTLEFGRLYCVRVWEFLKSFYGHVVVLILVKIPSSSTIVSMIISAKGINPSELASTLCLTVIHKNMLE